VREQSHRQSGTSLGSCGRTRNQTKQPTHRRIHTHATRIEQLGTHHRSHIGTQTHEQACNRTAEACRRWTAGSAGTSRCSGRRPRGTAGTHLRHCAHHIAWDGTLNEAPWLVNGEHGALLRHRLYQSAPAPPRAESSARPTAPAAAFPPRPRLGTHTHGMWQLQTKHTTRANACAPVRVDIIL
jgi:hypothetical protein